MSNLLNKKLQKESKKFVTNSSTTFIDGGNYARHIYDTALIKLFGKKLGLMISNYLLLVGIKEN